MPSSGRRSRNATPWWQPRLALLPDERRHLVHLPRASDTSQNSAIDLHRQEGARKLLADEAVLNLAVSQNANGNNRRALFLSLTSSIYSHSVSPLSTPLPRILSRTFRSFYATGTAPPPTDTRAHHVMRQYSASFRSSCFKTRRLQLYKFASIPQWSSPLSHRRSLVRSPGNTPFFFSILHRCRSLGRGPLFPEQLVAGARHAANCHRRSAPGSPAQIQIWLIYENPPRVL
jgi:hypothetical protein